MVVGTMSTLQTWVIVADSSRARCFAMIEDRTLSEFESLVSPQQRLHEAELTSDRSGRTFDSGGQGSHAMEPPQTVREHDAEEFARRLAARVEGGRVAGEIERLVLIAPPKFLGLIRSKLSEGSSRLVALSIAKDLTIRSADEVLEHIPDRF